ncbi:alpha/beta hydrolase family esterase [Corynebacterium kutscheri]|uniref:alpha/beta hydrolase family esterase n=1 Tax=Corynebacterium kutscheri TaxID=35755 RepID=UPI0037C1331E
MNIFFPLRCFIHALNAAVLSIVLILSVIPVVSAQEVADSILEESEENYVQDNSVSVLLEGAGDVAEAEIIEAPVEDAVTVLDVPELPVVAGQTMSIETLTADAMSRRYLLSVPVNYDSGIAVPVLFAFGGWNNSPEVFRDYSRLNEIAGEEAIIVYPEGVGHAWVGAPYALTSQEQDINFVRQIIDEVAHHYTVDRERIYATGMSNGGGMAALLGCHVPELFAGIAMVSGVYYTPVNQNCSSISIPSLFIHGTDDDVVHYEGGQRHEAYYFPVAEMLASYAERNACTNTPPRTTFVGVGVERQEFENCAAETQHIKALGQAHIWNTEPNAAWEVWSFLARQHRVL